MKIVNIRGGLGNQMFQYAFAIALKAKYPQEVIYIDTQLYSFPLVKTFRGNNFYHNGYEVEKIFSNAKLPIASWREVARVSYYIPNYIMNRFARKILPKRSAEYIQPSYDAYIYDPLALETSNKSYFEGYWFSPHFYDSCKQIILEVFQFRPFNTEENVKLGKKLALDNSVTIHIRRGDFLNIPIFKDICTLDYYIKAIEESKKHISNPVFYIFSNDQSWCKDNLKEMLGSNSVIYVDNNKGNESYRDMQLMSMARCNILANSSFSWWGAYLNQREDQIVFAPKNWVNMPCDDACPDEWIKVK